MAFTLGKVVGGGGSLTPTQSGNLDANTLARHTHANQAVLDGTEESFTTAISDSINNKTDKTYVDTQLSIKVNVQAGKGLSDENFTTAEKTKLGNINDKFKGLVADAAARDVLVPVPLNGDTVVQNDTDTIWFYDGATWVDTGSTSTGDMLAAIYDPTSIAGDVFDLDNMVDSVNFVKMTTAERTKLTNTEQLTVAEKALIPTQAEADKLTALPTRAGLDTELAGKQDTLVSGTSIKTVNGNALLGTGDLAIDGGVEGITYSLTTDTVVMSKDARFNKSVIFDDPSSSRIVTTTWEADTTDATKRNLVFTPSSAGTTLIEMYDLYVRNEIDTGNLWATGNVYAAGEFRSTGPNIEFKNSFAAGMYLSGGGSVRPYANGTQDVGQSTFRFRTYYSVNSLNASSDERYKDFNGAVDYKHLRNLTGQYYTWKAGTPMEYESDIGLSAQEVAKYYPDLVNYDHASDFYSMAYERLNVVLINYCNGLQNEVDGLRERLDALENPTKKKRKWYYLWLI